MFQAIRGIIFAFTAVCCLIIGGFWLWFLNEYSLKWLDGDGNVNLAANSGVVFGREGAEWMGMIAIGWFALALLFGLMQWRFNRAGQASVASISGSSDS